MMANSRISIQEKPRNLNKKNPGKTYLPRFLDESDITTLKSSVDRELADIAMYMEKERQVVSKIVPGSIFKGTWDACTDKYPDPKDENSTWDVLVSCGESHDFDNKTWKVGQQLMWLNASEIFIQRTNPSVEGIVEKVDKLEVKVDNANANISDLKLAVADTNFALAQTKQELEAKVNDNTSKISQTNEVVADLSKTVATQKIELESSIKGVKDIVDKNKVDGDKADAENKKLIVEAQSNINITNQTLADLDKTVATNKTELESKYQGVLTTVDGVQQEVTETKASLAQTNKTVADNKQAAAQATTDLRSEMNGQVANINQSMSTISGKVNTAEGEIDVLQSKWTVQADVNGKISGIEMVNDGRKSNFTILTDRFVVTDGSTTKPPFSIESGKVAMKDVRVSGHIEANTGTFKGNLEVADQAGNVGMKITNSQMLIYDENGRLRVVIGRL